MATKKEPLKTRNPYKYYRNAYVGAQAGEWACIGIPIIAIFGAKWNEYFNFTDNQGGAIKLTIGSILALICAAIFMYKKIKHQEKTEKKVTMLSYVIGVGVAFAIAYFFKVILDDLVLIFGCELAGAAAAYAEVPVFFTFLRLHESRSVPLREQRGAVSPPCGDLHRGAVFRRTGGGAERRGSGSGLQRGPQTEGRSDQPGPDPHRPSGLRTDRPAAQSNTGRL